MERQSTQFKFDARIIYLFLAALPVAALSEYYLHNDTLTFVFSALGIIPLAKIIGDATEEITEVSGPQWGGLLNATFGNAVELILAAAALMAGLEEVVKATLVGSIISNLLLVLGASMFFGGRRFQQQSFNETAAHADVSALNLAVCAILAPTVFGIVSQTSSTESSDLAGFSFVVAFVLIGMYVSRLLFSLKTHSHLYAGEAELEEHEGNGWITSIAVLFGATLVVACASEWLVGSIEPAAESLGWSMPFISVILLPILGNAAEHASAITAAVKDKMGLALEIAVGSSMQIALLLCPVLVILGAFTGHPMTLSFNLFEVVSLFFAVLAVGNVANDGQSNWLEGAMLLACYFVLAAGYWFLRSLAG
jgi:Ca2+:H+ antiporter